MILEDSRKNRNFIGFFELLLRDVKEETLRMAVFGVFLDAPLARPIIGTLIFLGMKGAKVVHISYKIHLRLTCSSWVFNLQMFS